MTEDNVSVEFYMLDSIGEKIVFTLESYVPEFTGDSILYLFHTINYSLKEIHSSKFDPERESVVSLRNNTPYKLRVISPQNNVRDFNFITLQATETTKTIQILDLDLTDAIDHYEGDLSMVYTTNEHTGEVTLTFSKGSGSLEWINFTVYRANSTPYAQLYSVEVEDTASGVFSWTVPNLTNSYLLHTEAVNEGKNIKKMLGVVLKNTSVRLGGISLPAAGLFGISVENIFKGIVMFIAVVLAFGFGAVDAGIGAIVLGGYLLIVNALNWVKIPWYIMTLIAVLAVALHMSRGRRTE